MTLQRWEPFREMESLRDAIDRLFRESFVRPSAMLLPAGQVQGAFSLDLADTPENFVVRASLPGIKPEDVQVTVQGNTLTIQGERKADEERYGQNWLLREQQFGSFQRSLTLPTPVNADQAQAHYENGILTLTLPKAEEARPKQIQIKGGSQAQLGAGQASTEAQPQTS